MGEDSDPEFMAVVFPPSKHENLHLLPLPTVSLSPQSSSSTSNFSSPFSYSSPSLSSSESFSSSDADEEEDDDPRPSELSPIKVSGQGSAGFGWLRITIGMIRSKVLGKVRFPRGSVDGERGGVFWSMGALAAVIAWVWWLYMRIRFRRRWTRLVQGIRERDERIGQLLHQIAQMNEVLLLKHKELASRLANGCNAP